MPLHMETAPFSSQCPTAVEGGLPTHCATTHTHCHSPHCTSTHRHRHSELHWMATGSMVVASRPAPPNARVPLTTRKGKGVWVRGLNARARDHQNAAAASALIKLNSWPMTLAQSSTVNFLVAMQEQIKWATWQSAISPAATTAPRGPLPSRHRTRLRGQYH